MRRIAHLIAPLWSLAYLVLGLAWLAGLGGNPADPAVDKDADITLIGLWGPAAGAAILAALGAAGLVASALLWRRGRAAVPFAVTLGLLLAVVLPDYRVLVHIAYTPIVLVLFVLDKVPDGRLWPWPVLSLGLMCAAGIALLVQAKDAVRAKDDGPRDAASLARWNRRGRWAVAVAVAVPVGYAFTRVMWALDIPFGITRDFLDEIGDARHAGAALGAMGVGGAILTLGLVQRWGEVFPRWMIGLRGRRVPIGLATVPARLVAVTVTSAGLMYIRFAVTGEFGSHFGFGDGQWAAILPELFWPLWGAALAVASYAYEIRRSSEPTVSPGPRRATRAAGAVTPGTAPPVAPPVR
jgi:hypothetical protein